MNNHPQNIIDENPMAGIQIAVVALCIMLNALDGFDVLSISFASPGIASEWNVERAALGVVLSMELIGMGVGSILLGGLADSRGRRPTILCCLVIMSVGMLAAGLASGVVELSLYRFVTGLGIGGMLASTNAMVAEFSNSRHRSMSVMLMAGGYPLGAVVGGAIAAQLLAEYDWRYVFYFGAAATASFLVLVWFALPESIAFLSQKRPPGALEQINKILSRAGHRTLTALPERESGKNDTPMQIFSPEMRKITALLTLAYFAHIMAFYFFIKWIPKLVVDMGFDESSAGGVLVWANVGSVVGCILLGILSHRITVRWLAISVLAGSSAALVAFGQGQADLTQLAVFAAICGFFTNGAIVCMYALFAQSFSTSTRASGTGFVIGVGRAGAALGPIVAGFLFAVGLGLSHVALLMAVGCIVAAIAIFALPARESNTSHSGPIQS